MASKHHPTLRTAHLDDKGNQIELLVNGIGVFNGSKAVQVPVDGNYLLNSKIITMDVTIIGEIMKKITTTEDGRCSE